MAEAWSILADHGEKRQTALQPSVPPQKSAKARNSKAASVCRRLAALPSSPSVPFSWTVFVGLSDRPVNDVRLAFTFVPPSVPRRDASSGTAASKFPRQHAGGPRRRCATRLGADRTPGGCQPVAGPAAPAGISAAKADLRISECSPLRLGGIVSWHRSRMLRRRSRPR